MAYYSFPDESTIEGLVNLGLYEEVFNLPIEFTIRQLHNVYIAYQTEYSKDIRIQKLISKAYNFLKNEKMPHKGIRLFNNGHVKECIPILQKAVKVKQNEELCTILASALYLSEDYKKAIPLLHYLCKENTNKTLVFYLGMSLYKTEKPDEALQWLKKASEAGEDDAHYYAGKLLFEKKEYKLAIPFLEKSLRYDKNPDALFYLAISCYNIDLYDRGLRYIEDLLVLASDPEYYQWYAKLCLKNNMTKKAFSTLRSLTQLRGNSSDFLWCGIALCECGKYKESLYYLEKAYEKNASPDVRMWLDYARKKSGSSQ